MKIFLPLALFFGVSAMCQTPSLSRLDYLHARYRALQDAVDHTMDAEAVKRLNAELLKAEIALDQAEARQTAEEEDRWFAEHDRHPAARASASK